MWKTGVEPTAMNVPGKKTVVKTAIVFMEELSLLDALASLLESCAMARFNLLSRCPNNV